MPQSRSCQKRYTLVRSALFGILENIKTSTMTRRLRTVNKVVNSIQYGHPNHTCDRKHSLSSVSTNKKDHSCMKFSSVALEAFPAPTLARILIFLDYRTLRTLCDVAPKKIADLARETLFEQFVRGHEQWSFRDSASTTLMKGGCIYDKTQIDSKKMLNSIIRGSFALENSPKAHKLVKEGVVRNTYGEGQGSGRGLVIDDKEFDRVPAQCVQKPSVEKLPDEILLPILEGQSYKTLCIVASCGHTNLSRVAGGLLLKMRDVQYMGARSAALRKSTSERKLGERVEQISCLSEQQAEERASWPAVNELGENHLGVDFKLVNEITRNVGRENADCETVLRLGSFWRIIRSSR